MGGDLTIRHARPDDAPAMARVIVDTWLETHHGQIPEQLWQQRVSEWTHEVSEAAWRRDLAAIDDGSLPGHIFLVAVEGSAVVGVAASRPGGDRSTAEVGSLYVLRGHQRRGVGRALADDLMASHADRGATRLLIGVLAANLAGRAFYEAIGGRVVAEREFDEGGTMLPELVYGWDLERA